MAGKTYQEKLLDPRWQKVRLKVFERDGWACKSCGDATNTLHVHHKEYVRGKEPWESDLETYVTLCEKCHSRERTERYGLEKRLLAELKRAGVLVSDLEGLAAQLISRNSSEFQQALAEFLDAFRLVFENDWEFTKGRIADEPQNGYISKSDTFLHPKVSNESNNWANRGSLLRAYRNLLSVMKNLQIPIEPFFDDFPVGEQEDGIDIRGLLPEEEFQERSRRVVELEVQGAVWLPEVHCYVLGERCYDEDGNPL